MHSLRVVLGSRQVTSCRRIAPFSWLIQQPYLKKKSLLRTVSSATETSANETSSKSWRENPNTKYWVIGALGITGTIYYYVYKDREKKRLITKNMPPLPAHYIHPRNKDIAELEKLHSHLKSRSSLVVLQIVGPKGYGKTVLARTFAEKLAKQEEEKYEFIPGNHLLGTINASSLESMVFDVKRFAIALGCVSKDWTSRASEEKLFVSLTKEEQLGCLVGAVKEKLVGSPGWVLVLDNLKDEETLTRWFLNEESNEEWGKGTILVTKHGMSRNESIFSNVYSLEKGMSEEEAVDTLCTLSGLSEDKRNGAEEVARRLGRVPLAIACAGHYIHSKATKDPEYSFSQYLTELNSALGRVKYVSGTDDIINLLHSTFVAVAMETKSLMEEAPHFLHTFDLIGACQPDWPIPISLISLHLRSPDFSLPLVVGSGPALPSQSSVEANAKETAEEEVPEMFLSIKRLAKNLEEFTTAVKANVEAVKAMFNPQPMDIPLPIDGVVELMRACPLVSVMRVDPGGVETIVVSPVVHSVFQQLFLSKTAAELEEQYLAQAEDKHNRSSWFRRLWSFDPQRTLQEYRNSLGEGGEAGEVLNQSAEAEVKWNTSHSEVSVRSLFEKPIKWEETESYRMIKPRDAIRHCQQHTGRALKTINNLASVCGQDTSTQTLAKLIKPHLDHILATNTPQSLGPKTRAHALSAVASIDASAGDLKSSRDLLENVLPIETQLFGESSLEVAATLTRLADVYSSLDEAAKSRELLENALQIYKKQRQKAGEYKKPLEFARAMAALGGVYGTLGFKERSSDYIERAFSFMQSAAPTNPDEIERRRFAGDVTSTLTDLGHAYLSIGNTTQARKILDMALTGHKNLHGDEHPEVVRTLTVLGIAYTMQGNWQEGKRMRKEAGKVQAKLDSSPQL